MGKTTRFPCGNFLVVDGRTLCILVFIVWLLISRDLFLCTFVLAFKNLYCAPSSRHTRTHFIFLHKHSCTYTQRTFSVSTLCIFMQMLELTFIWSRCVCSHQRDFYLPTASCCRYAAFIPTHFVFFLTFFPVDWFIFSLQLCVVPCKNEAEDNNSHICMQIFCCPTSVTQW